MFGSDFLFFCGSLFLMLLYRCRSCLVFSLRNENSFLPLSLHCVVDGLS